MNKRQAEQKLRQLMKLKPKITQPGRLLAHLLNELKVESDGTRSQSATIERALEKLEKDGIVKLDRKGGVLNGYDVTTKGKRELNGQKKAAAAPAPKETTATPVAPEVAATVDETASTDDTSEKMPRHELVTMALHALQELADAQGNLHVQSAITTIANSLDLPETEARELNRSLGELGLRKSPRGRNDDGKRPHWVTQHIKEVTEDMLSQGGKQGDERPEGETYSQLIEIITGLEHDLATALSNAQATDHLMEIIGGLEADKAELEAQVAELSEQKARDQQALLDGSETLNRLTDSNRQLTEELASVRAQLSEANAKLLQRLAPTPEVEAVLARYGKNTKVVGSR